MWAVSFCRLESWTGWKEGNIHWPAASISSLAVNATGAAALSFLPSWLPHHHELELWTNNRWNTQHGSRFDLFVNNGLRLRLWVLFLSLPSRLLYRKQNGEPMHSEFSWLYKSMELGTLESCYQILLVNSLTHFNKERRSNKHQTV